MSDIAISVQNLSKRYRIGKSEAQTTKRRSITRRITSPFQYLYSTLRQPAPDEVIWALKDVSFEVKHGEVLGVIGRNGAGKSTLLKILSRITEPTSGRAILNGRVGSLLEVGTGFHPELTGRENIYLSGAILGMKKAEIDRKFDEIVDFSGVEKFIDTPVKRYSSGMRVRLAFAVAAHLEPEILLIDEVLAVGDAEFQKRCLGKMSNVAQEGRTIIFVSHNMGSVQNLTEKAIYLKNGQLSAYDKSGKIIEQYLTEIGSLNNQDLNQLDHYRREYNPDSPIKTTYIWINKKSSNIATLILGKPIQIHFQLEVLTKITNANITIVIKNSKGERIGLIFSWDQNFKLNLEKGTYTLSAYIKNLSLPPGQYYVDLGINQTTQTRAYDLVMDYPLFRIESPEGMKYWIDRPWGTVHFDNVIWNIV